MQTGNHYQVNCVHLPLASEALPNLVTKSKRQLDVSSKYNPMQSMNKNHQVSMRSRRFESTL